MVKKYYDFHFELNIDGQPCPPEIAAPFFQRNPFPGGHEYTCVISGERLGKYFDYMPVGKAESVSEEDARRFFQSLGLSWNLTPDEQGVRAEYFLNSVKEMDFDGERIKFSGLCSPIVRLKDRSITSCCT
jgi:hypothetical protein